MTGKIEYWSPQLLGLSPERFIERCARVAYRSEDKMSDVSYQQFIPKVVVKKRDHSVAEHTGLVVKFYIPDVASDILQLLEVNPTIPWRINEEEESVTLLFNGRHAIELLEAKKDNFIWHDSRSNLEEIFPTLLEIKSSELTTESSIDYSGEAHEDCGDPRFIQATYYVTGISRVTETQWVRHRRMSYTVMSGRGVDVREERMVVPPTFQSVFKNSWIYGESLQKAIINTYKLYEVMRDQFKIPRQDCRYIIPQGCATEMVVTATLEWWNYFFTLRANVPAQWEIMEFAKAIQHDLHMRYPQYIRPVVEVVGESAS